MNPINLQSFLAFLSYFGTGLGVLIVSVVLVTLVTPHKDFTCCGRAMWRRRLRWPAT